MTIEQDEFAKHNESEWISNDSNAILQNAKNLHISYFFLNRENLFCGEGAYWGLPPITVRTVGFLRENYDPIFLNEGLFATTTGVKLHLNESHAAPRPVGRSRMWKSAKVWWAL